MDPQKPEARNVPGRIFRAHPWHGIDRGKRFPDSLNVYIEIVPSDGMKFELDKTTGILEIDRPQRSSNHCPARYGLIPRTLCGDLVGKYCAAPALLVTGLPSTYACFVKGISITAMSS
jgi:inorganic pyrophosphatase